VAFYFFSGIGIKVSGVDVGFVAGVIRVSSEGVKKFLEVSFVRYCEYRSVSHSRSSPEEGQVCQHEGAVADVDCKERGMICQGV